MKIQSIVLLVAALAATQGAAPAQDQNKQIRDQEAWYDFTDKEQRSGFKTSKPHHATPPADVAPSVAPAQTNKESTYFVPYLLTQPAAEPAPATTHVETTLEPVYHPGTVAPIWGGGGPFWGGYGWGGNNYWGGSNFGWGGPLHAGGWRAPLGLFNTGPSMTLRPINKVVQTGPSKASGNYFNSSTADPTASGSYYAPSTPSPKLTPLYQPEAESKDYWGKKGNPLPPEMQAE